MDTEMPFLSILSCNNNKILKSQCPTHISHFKSLSADFVLPMKF
jgi:hypothetical protein